MSFIKNAEKTLWGDSKWEGHLKNGQRHRNLYKQGNVSTQTDALRILRGTSSTVKRPIPVVHYSQCSQWLYLRSVMPRAIKIWNEYVRKRKTFMKYWQTSLWEISIVRSNLSTLVTWRSYLARVTRPPSRKKFTSTVEKMADQGKVASTR